MFTMYSAYALETSQDAQSLSRRIGYYKTLEEAQDAAKKYVDIWIDSAANYDKDFILTELEVLNYLEGNKAHPEMNKENSFTAVLDYVPDYELESKGSLGDFSGCVIYKIQL